MKKIIINEHNQLKEEKLRIAAEIDNFKKRIKKENEINKKLLLKSFILNLLPFIDNIERGLNVTSGTKDYDALAKGIKISLDAYLKSLKTFSVKPFDSVGKEFNPAFHEAISTQKCYNIEKNKVIEEVTKGYCLNDKVIRPARVVVST